MSGVINEVRDEATADSIVERIVAARSRAKTEVDRRALDLLELLVERRAAELQNQPGPHAKSADRHAPGVEAAMVALASRGLLPNCWRRWGTFPNNRWPMSRLRSWRVFTATRSGQRLIA